MTPISNKDIRYGKQVFKPVAEENKLHMEDVMKANEENMSERCYVVKSKCGWYYDDNDKLTVKQLKAKRYSLEDAEIAMDKNYHNYIVRAIKLVPKKQMTKYYIKFRTSGEYINADYCTDNDSFSTPDKESAWWTYSDIDLKEFVDSQTHTHFLKHGEPYIVKVVKKKAVKDVNDEPKTHQWLVCFPNMENIVVAISATEAINSAVASHHNNRHKITDVISVKRTN